MRRNEWPALPIVGLLRVFPTHGRIVSDCGPSRRRAARSTGLSRVRRFESPTHHVVDELLSAPGTGNGAARVCLRPAYHTSITIKDLKRLRFTRGWLDRFE